MILLSVHDELVKTTNLQPIVMTGVNIQRMRCSLYVERIEIESNRLRSIYIERVDIVDFVRVWQRIVRWRYESGWISHRYVPTVFIWNIKDSFQNFLPSNSVQKEYGVRRPRTIGHPAYGAPNDPVFLKKCRQVFMNAEKVCEKRLWRWASRIWGGTGKIFFK